MRRKNKMIVYELSWWYLDEESGKSDEQVIGEYPKVCVNLQTDVR